MSTLPCKLVKLMHTIAHTVLPIFYNFFCYRLARPSLALIAKIAIGLVPCFARETTCRVPDSNMFDSSTHVLNQDKV